MDCYPVKFTPIPTESIWGGHRLKTCFGCEKLPQPIGEYWLVSGHPSATSVVANGAWAGLSLTELTTRYPEAYLGDSPQPRFPLLVKAIEASADLSVQVHPDDAYAREHEQDFGKTEAWYVLAAPPDGRVVYGHHFTDRADYFAAVEQGRVQDFLRYQQIAPGQFIYVPAGTLHAILAETAVIEIQQTSDLTYRVYDWDRLDANEQPRALHVSKAADVLDYGKGSVEPSLPMPVRMESGLLHERLLECPYFSIEKINVLARGYMLQLPLGKPNILIGIAGTGSVRWPHGEELLHGGEAMLVPATLSVVELLTEGEWTVLRVYG